MTKRQAKVAAALINASSMAMTDTPEEIPGAKKEDDVQKVVQASNEAGWVVLHRYGFESPLTVEAAYTYAIQNY